MAPPRSSQLKEEPTAKMSMSEQETQVGVPSPLLEQIPRSFPRLSEDLLRLFPFHIVSPEDAVCLLFVTPSLSYGCHICHLQSHPVHSFTKCLLNTYYAHAWTEETTGNQADMLFALTSWSLAGETDEKQAHERQLCWMNGTYLTTCKVDSFPCSHPQLVLSWLLSLLQVGTYLFVCVSFWNWMEVPESLSDDMLALLTLSPV